MIHYEKQGVLLAKFKFVYWLVEFLFSQERFFFEWDDGNSTKNEDKHNLTIEEIESVFEDNNILALGEQYQPVIASEYRYGVLGKSFNDSVLFVCFTIREGKIRPISVRPANKKERSIYEE